MKNHYTQTGEGHCLVCHKTMMPGDTHYYTCWMKKGSPCTKKCGKWYKDPATNACGGIEIKGNERRKFYQKGYDEGYNDGKQHALDIIAEGRGWEESYDECAKKLGLPLKYKK